MVRGDVVKIFPNSKCVIWPYLGLETFELGDSNLRRILIPLAENVLKTLRSDYWYKTLEFGSKVQPLIWFDQSDQSSCLCHMSSFGYPI